MLFYKSKEEFSQSMNIHTKNCYKTTIDKSLKYGQ